MEAEPDKNANEEPVLECWCGARGTYNELFSDDLDESCGGSGELNCYCGGDFCVCHHHGSTECDGCEDCQDEDDWSDYDWSDYDDEE